MCGSASNIRMAHLRTGALVVMFILSCSTAAGQEAPNPETSDRSYTVGVRDTVAYHAGGRVHHAPRMMRQETRPDRAALSLEVDAEAAPVLAEPDGAGALLAEEASEADEQDPTKTGPSSGSSSPYGSQDNVDGPGDYDGSAPVAQRSQGSQPVWDIVRDENGNILGDGWLLTGANKNICPKGSKDLSIQDCKTLADKLRQNKGAVQTIPDLAKGFQEDLSQSMSSASEPKGCFLRSGLGVIFNRDIVGKKSALAKKFCASKPPGSNAGGYTRRSTKSQDNSTYSSGNLKGLPFVIGQVNSNYCPKGSRQMTEEECKKAAVNLERTFVLVTGTETQYGFPPAGGCFFYQGYAEKVFYNVDEGQASYKAKLVCMQEAASDAGNAYGIYKTAAPTPTPTTTSTTTSTTSTTSTTAISTTTPVSAAVQPNASKEAVNDTNSTTNATNITNATNATGNAKKRGPLLFFLLVVCCCCCCGGGGVFLVMNNNNKGLSEEQEEFEEKPANYGGEGGAAEGENTIGLNSYVTVLSTGRNGTVTYGPDENWNYAVTYEDDGTTSELLPYTDLQAATPAEAPATEG